MLCWRSSAFIGDEMRKSIKRLGFLVAVAGAIVLQGCQQAASSYFTLWQLPSQTVGQNMSYVLRSDGGHVIVVDGGNTGDAGYIGVYGVRV